MPVWQEIDDVLMNRVGKKEVYLPKHSDEPEDSYQLRKTLARFKAEIPRILTNTASKVFSIPPTRDEDTERDFANLIANADGTGVSLNRYMRDRLKDAMAYGASIILVEKPQTEVVKNEDGSKTDLNVSVEETSKGFVAEVESVELSKNQVNLVRYKIFQVINWSVDARGELNWIRIKDEKIRQDSPEDVARMETLYREFDRKSWRIFKVVEKDGESPEVKDKEDGNEIDFSELSDSELDAVEVGSGDHNLGMVPIAVLGPVRDGVEFSFESLIRDSYHADIERYQDWADIRYDTHLHAHPTQWFRSDRKKHEIGTMGPNSRVYWEGEEEAGYMEYPSGATEQLRENCREYSRIVNRAAGTSSAGEGESGVMNTSSGRARAMAFSVNDRPILADLANACQICETRIFEIATRWYLEGEAPPANVAEFASPPSYSTRFDLSGGDELIDQWQQIRLGVNSDTLDRELQNRIVDTILPDLSPELRALVGEEIKNNELLKEDPLLEPNDAFSAGSAIREVEADAEREVREAGREAGA